MGKSFVYLVLKLFFVVMLLCGCALVKQSAPPPEDNLVNGRPYWYWKPSSDGVIGGVGEAGSNINGVSAQRQLAIDRALDDIARQKGVSVKQIQEITQQDTQTSSSVNINTYSIHAVDGTVVSAVIREIWQEPGTGKIVVWITEYK
ncbi:MAG: hypothetical protein LBH05_01100 [Deferribacteraceae bacterium]|jgi:hypothetical protein|nr:hypothetical protein [Deferribacteraceae bacterium]